ncbi:760_t:CDS:2, partial [Acaulospora morrowiae]
MKFSKVLKAECVPEWKRKYIDYKGLKKLLSSVEKERITRIIQEYKSSDSPRSKSQKDDIPISEIPIAGGCCGETGDISANINLRIPPQSHEISRRNNIAYSLPLLTTKREHSSIERNCLPSNKSLGMRNVPERNNSLLNKLSLRISLATNENARSRIVSIDTLMDQVDEEEKKFFIALQNEIKKVSEFYDEKQEEAYQKFQKLKQVFEEILSIKECSNLSHPRRSRLFSFIDSNANVSSMSKSSTDLHNDGDI